MPRGEGEHEWRTRSRLIHFPSFPAFTSSELAWSVVTQKDTFPKERQRWLSAFHGSFSIKASVVKMQRLSYPAETVLYIKITKNRIVLPFKDSPGKPLGRRPSISQSHPAPINEVAWGWLSQPSWKLRSEIHATLHNCVCKTCIRGSEFYF